MGWREAYDSFWILILKVALGAAAVYGAAKIWYFVQHGG